MLELNSHELCAIDTVVEDTGSEFFRDLEMNACTCGRPGCYYGDGSCFSKNAE